LGIVIFNRPGRGPTDEIRISSGPRFAAAGPARAGFHLFAGVPSQFLMSLDKARRSGARTILSAPRKGSARGHCGPQPPGFPFENAAQDNRAWLKNDGFACPGFFA
jgi:hypothetical protein